MKPTSSRAILVLAIFAIGLGVRPAAAEIVWSKEAGWIEESELAGDTARASFLHGVWLATRGQMHAAIREMRKFERRYPDSDLLPQARACLAEWLLRADRPAEVVEVVLKEAGEPDDESALSSASTVDDKTQERLAKAGYQAAIELAQESPSQGVTALGQMLGNYGNFADSSARYAYGTSLLKTGDYESALEVFKEYLERHPEGPHHADALLYAGLAAVRRNRVKGHSTEYLTAGQEFLERYLAEKPSGEFANLAETYLKAISFLMEEEDPERRTAFYVITLFADGSIQRAYKAFKKGASKFAGSIAGETARFYQAECLLKRGKHRKAFNIYAKLQTEYPGGSWRLEALDRQFQIARTVAVNRPNRAVRMLSDLLDQEPYESLADDVELLLADCYRRIGNYERAAFHYQFILENYFHSEHVPAAMLRCGTCKIEIAGELGDKNYLLRDGRAYVEQYLLDEPDGAYAQEAREYKVKALELEAANIFRIAQFYQRKKETKAALLCYERVVSRYPDTSWAAHAREFMSALREGEANTP